MNAEELRKIAYKKMYENFKKNCDYCITTLDEKIELDAKNFGYTAIVLEHFTYNQKYVYTLDGKNFSIDKETYKEIKKYFKKKGFRVKKFWRLITISWW